MKHGFVERRVEPAKKCIEFILVLATLVMGVIFLSRTWPMPAAKFSIKVDNRMPSQETQNKDNVIISGNFEVSSAANLLLTGLASQCQTVSGSEACELDCKDLETNLVIDSEKKGGNFPSGDGRNWSCIAKVQSGSCVYIKQTILGKAKGFRIGGSLWRASTISCPENALGKK